MFPNVAKQHKTRKIISGTGLLITDIATTPYAQTGLFFFELLNQFHDIISVFQIDFLLFYKKREHTLYRIIEIAAEQLIGGKSLVLFLTDDRIVLMALAKSIMVDKSFSLQYPHKGGNGIVS